MRVPLDERPPPRLRSLQIIDVLKSDFGYTDEDIKGFPGYATNPIYYDILYYVCEMNEIAFDTHEVEGIIKGFGIKLREFCNQLVIDRSKFKEKLCKQSHYGTCHVSPWTRRVELGLRCLYQRQHVQLYYNIGWKAYRKNPDIDVHPELSQERVKAEALALGYENLAAFSGLGKETLYVYAASKPNSFGVNNKLARLDRIIQEYKAYHNLNSLKDCREHRTGQRRVKRQASSPHPIAFVPSLPPETIPEDPFDRYCRENEQPSQTEPHVPIAASEAEDMNGFLREVGLLKDD